MASYGNIDIILLQQYQATPSFTSSTLATLAAYTTALSAAGNAGLRVIPVVNFNATPGQPITRGGNDQTTYRGRTILLGMGHASATAELEGVDAELADQASQFTQFSVVGSGRSRLRAYFITEDGFIICGPDYNGVEVFSWSVSDVTKGGAFRPVDKYMINMHMDYGWSFKSKTVKLAFDPAVLINPAP